MTTEIDRFTKSKSRPIGAIPMLEKYLGFIEHMPCIFLDLLEKCSVTYGDFQFVRIFPKKMYLIFDFVFLPP